jgi:hypothetical protein
VFKPYLLTVLTNSTSCVKIAGSIVVVATVDPAIPGMTNSSVAIGTAKKLNIL